jgi:hypothetical protein
MSIFIDHRDIREMALKMQVTFEVVAIKQFRFCFFWARINIQYTIDDLLFTSVAERIELDPIVLLFCFFIVFDD